MRVFVQTRPPFENQYVLAKTKLLVFFIELTAHRNNFTDICLHRSIHDPLHVDISNGFLRRKGAKSHEPETPDINDALAFSPHSSFALQVKQLIWKNKASRSRHTNDK